MSDNTAEAWTDITEPGRLIRSRPAAAMRWVLRERYKNGVGEITMTRALVEQLGWDFPLVVRIAVSPGKDRLRVHVAEKGRKVSQTGKAGQFRVQMPWVKAQPPLRAELEWEIEGDGLILALPDWARPSAAPADPRPAAAPPVAPPPKALPPETPVLARNPPAVAVPGSSRFARTAAPRLAPPTPALSAFAKPVPADTDAHPDKEEAVNLLSGGWGARKVADEMGLPLGLVSEWAMELREKRERGEGAA